MHLPGVFMLLFVETGTAVFQTKVQIVHSLQV